MHDPPVCFSVSPKKDIMFLPEFFLSTKDKHHTLRAIGLNNWPLLKSIMVPLGNHRKSWFGRKFNDMGKCLWSSIK